MHPNGLCVAKCIKNFGGSKPFTRDSIILAEDIKEYTATNKLKVGEKQCMQYDATHNGPFYMSDKEREDQQYDKKVGMREVCLNKDKLMTHLRDVGIENPVGSKEKLRSLCKQNNLPTKKKVDKILEGKEEGG
jgi:hypothetical protein